MLELFPNFDLKFCVESFHWPTLRPEITNIRNGAKSLFFYYVLVIVNRIDDFAALKYCNIIIPSALLFYIELLYLSFKIE